MRMTFDDFLHRTFAYMQFCGGFFERVYASKWFVVIRGNWYFHYSPSKRPPRHADGQLVS
jgi:hypothetical protein